MGVNSVSEQSSAWGAAFRSKPVFFMTGKETEAFFEGKNADEHGTAGG